MTTWNSIARGAAAAGLSLACTLAGAAAVTLTYSGTVSGYDFIDLSAGMPIGTAMNLSVSFNETFSDGSYNFSDNLGPISGSMTVGNASYQLDNYTPSSYQFDAGGLLTGVQLHLLGSGPQLGDGDFFGLFINLTPGLSLQFDVRLGYGFTTNYPDGYSATSYGYAIFATDSFQVTPTNAVPAPATLPLVAVALLAAGWSRRRGRAPAQVSF